MPDLQIEFTDSEMELVLAAANAAGQSVEDFAREAVLNVVDDDRRARISAISRMVAQKSAELNRRLE